MIKYISKLVSVPLSVLLLLVLVIAMAVATFIENDFGTLVARKAVYEAWWFEGIMVWLCISFISNIKRYHLLSKERLPIGLVHIAFIIIIIGAGVTRYVSKEGMVHIREGQKVNEYTTNERYIQFKVDTMLYSTTAQPIPYWFQEEKLSVIDNQDRWECVLDEYIPNAKLSYIDGKQTLLDISVTTQGETYHKIIDLNTSFELPNIAIIFTSDSLQNSSVTNTIGSSDKMVLTISKKDALYYIRSTQTLHSINMATEQMSSIGANSSMTTSTEVVYQNQVASFIINGIYENKQPAYVSEDVTEATTNDTEQDRVRVSVYKNGIFKTQAYFKAISNTPDWQVFSDNGKEFAFAYASIKKRLPFAIGLDRFEIKRYPGSQSPQSYKSYVQVLSPTDNFSTEIYMNNVLDYKGYRLYQSSYDTDEKGTLLTLNKDREGTIITYIGYALLFISMVLVAFTYRSRFQLLNRKLQKIKQSITIFLLVSSSIAYSNTTHSLSQEFSIPPREVALNYGRLIVQGADGRMKPLTTLSYEITRKITGKSYVIIGKEKLLPEQFLLAIQLNPQLMSNEAIIKIDKDKSALVFDRLQLPKSNTLRFADMLDNNGSYKLQTFVEEANRLKPSQRTEFQKELLKVDERFNILYALFSGNFLRIFPNKDAVNNQWFSAKEFKEFKKEEEAMFVKDIYSTYLNALLEAKQLGSYEQAEQVLDYIHIYQKEVGSEVYPSEQRLQAELFYTRARIGNYLFGLCILLGSVLLAVNVLRLFLQKHLLGTILKIGMGLSWGLWLVFTFDLLLRWYIAKHPPWSDGFEMLLLVSWWIVLFGLLFTKKSSFTLPLSLLFSGILLLVSFLDWLNPEITTLKPVLHSFWLKIHVAVIVGSYAPLALSCVTALLSLLLLIFKPVSPTKRWWASLQELIIVQEMSVTIGLFLLTAGTFLGGVWANESWGRYWAWDPKETWALISILVYAVVVHLRLIPAFKNAWWYHTATLWAFSTIVMTSYGVNYYLVGLHSYATGDPVPIPSWVYISVVFLLIVTLYSYFSFRKLSSCEKSRLF